MLVCGTHRGLYRLDGPNDDPARAAACGRVYEVARSGDARIAATAEGLFRSPDGEDWRRLDGPDDPVSVLAGPETLLVGTGNTGVLRARPAADGWRFDPVGDLDAHPHGDRWRDRAPGGAPSVRTLAVHPDDGVLAGIEPGGVYAFDGDFWRRYGEGVHDDVHDLRVLDGGAVVAATGNGLYRTDDGDRWVRLDTDFRDFWASYFREAIVHDARLYAGADRRGPEAPGGVTLSGAADDPAFDAVADPVPAADPAFAVSWAVVDGTLVGGTMRVDEDGFAPEASAPLVRRDGDEWTLGAELPAGVTSLAT
ncbi:BNR repeat-containing glycosyl hydrolase [Halorubrum californiense DSM 19288]|uniref:BNR repeat-containing glycosyl hydrolase n=1 Tax=Halorubrum californiense DSM 19288 TaxID=1227465 RepID=M0E9N7_9EURY|nr:MULTISPECIES: hypothetical protein [Halorubrum]ELZ43778.1 BNR repeat-containing glycosyl hydrolase [Halorubrum californiense DSM 19288]TKX72808.1 hypothetical protein EXE40_02205 [Halorubrum sp. GN11GM_10-3_MGM]